jgi:hypothetical protein
MIIIPAQLESYRSLKDKTIKVIFETNEPTPEQVLGIASANGQFGYLAFKTEMFKKNEKDAMENLESDYEDNGKTPSQRLRGVLYRCYEKNNESFDTFSRYYDHQMEKLLNHFKGKLD